ncbi:MAG: hypothetical protein JST73_05730 [Actinobacteria bacterium]|nr:hypothetical protein [Actinomycetota bacterium]
MAIAALVVTVTLAVAGCTPNPTMHVIVPAAFDDFLPHSMNNAGIAVGIAQKTAGTGNATDVAVAYDTVTGTFTQIPNVPPSSTLPQGATIGTVLDVNNDNVVLLHAGDEMGLYNMLTDTWNLFDCSPTVYGLTRGMLADNGYIACGDHVYDSVHAVDLPVAMPPGCAGAVTRVNSAGIAVGTCSAGAEPLFATELSTGQTIGFGSAQGLTVAAGTMPGAFTESGWLVAFEPGTNGPPVVYRIPTDLATGGPTAVSLGPFQNPPTAAVGISENGTVAVADITDVANDTMLLASYNVVTGQIRAFDTSGLPGGSGYGGRMILDVDDAGDAIGLQWSVPGQPAMEAFATAPRP